ncbi:hypothetical protein An09g04800 [Aspergillus niger]|uniref:Uncharacterized protein n=2 Tax=Aspergillus niger TaxID=5061 RepID=A2QU91_ASPNC|nr:hypothetical protein An09g04800 [Aspergillus niger]CAK40334.1 hypothetical protein An09g04800 [Aspergillus niger]
MGTRPKLMFETQDAVDEKVRSTVQTVEMEEARGRVRVPRLEEDRPVNREPQADHPRNFKFFRMLSQQQRPLVGNMESQGVEKEDRLGLVEGGGDWPIVQQGLLIGASTQFPRWVPEVPRPH